MKIYQSPYTLRGRKPGTADRQGCLLRIEWNSTEVGFADCFVWPELGDAGLEHQLQSLGSSTPHSVARQTLRFARLDAIARSQGTSLWSGCQVPKSHYLVADFRSMGEPELELCEQRGFASVKLKIRSSTLVTDLNSFLQLCRNRFRIRLDANEGFDGPGAALFLGQIADLSCIEFFEDPTPYRPETWRVLNELVPLALDRAGTGIGGYQFLIHKPACQDEIQSTNFPVCVTSYMDHPIGQCFAAYQAARLAKRTQVVVCGLQSHVVYEENDFSERFGPVSPTFTPPTGTGIGFDDLLERENWKTLV